MVKRDLTNEERDIYTKSLKRELPELELNEKALRVLTTELEILPTKMEVALETKKKELESQSARVAFLKSKVDSTKDFLENGVEVKGDTEEKEEENVEK